MASPSVSAEISMRNPQEQYELIQRVGSGTYGDVYKARDRQTGDQAGIKIVKLEPGDDFAIIQQEIIMMKDCRHQNIVQYLGSYLRKDRLWICMEFCGGGSLQDIYHVTGALSEPQIAFVCRETLRGLAYLHNMSKMHRDIKGANILLTDDGEVKLADFGVSAQITQTMCKRKSFIGTPYWMAPEVAAVERKGGYDVKCDIWAVGITAIEFAELQPPMFDLHPMRALFIMSKSGFKPPALKDRRKWTENFQNFVKVALTKQPRKRPTADKLLEHPFMLGNLTIRYTKELLDKMNSPNLQAEEPEDDEPEPPPASVLKRIPSSQQKPGKERPLSEINMEKVQFDTPIQQFNDVPAGHVSAWDDHEDKDSSRGHLGGDYNRELESTAPFPTDLLESVNDELKRREGTLTQPVASKRMPHPPPLPPRHSMVRSYADEEDREEEGGTLKGDVEPPRADNVPPELPPKQNMKHNGSVSASRMNGLPGDGKPAPEIPPRPARYMKKDLDKKPSKGLPPTPEVPMGACFSKVFNGCPLHINASASWIESDSRDQIIFIGAEEGIYALNLNEMHEGLLELVHARRCIWLHVVKNVLMSISGKNQHLFRHDLSMIYTKSKTHRMSMAIPERFVPKKFTPTSKVPDTKGCQSCAIVRNPYNGYKYLATCQTNGILLMQWYEPLNKFMQLKLFEVAIPNPLSCFELFVTPDEEYPHVCVGVTASNEGGSTVKFDTINLNTSVQWYTSEEYSSHKYLDASNITQLEKDTVLVCYDKHVKIVSRNGRLKSSSKQASQLTFHFPIQALVCLKDSVLAFHEHGMQGKSFKQNKVTQEILDGQRTYKLIGADRVVLIESRPSETPDADANLYILAGHENTY
ncbi:mitogen-activated protein kinase kinase kinase kinase 5-like isoform X2 [Watersipora subatra]|uniref:mitogen-activated protein kinase kinase kinase kinase 5-like isoform X2 n=1 Tax=Watersipora subatra TaxID=2589382 RepID=UPI00355B981B